jgi:hypothetical protein
MIKRDRTIWKGEEEEEDESEEEEEDESKCNIPTERSEYTYI